MGRRHGAGLSQGHSQIEAFTAYYLAKLISPLSFFTFCDSLLGGAEMIDSDHVS